jgi:uncharacterized glyoxalase superfamily protein PhnB
MIFLGSGSSNTEYSKLMARPGEIGNRITSSMYLVVNDADAVYEKVKAAGGEIVLDISDKPYGGRDFTLRDPEGYVWSVGTYDPWAQ